MARRRHGRHLVEVSVRVYRALLYAYPTSLRREFGADMAQVFRDSCIQGYRCKGVRGLARVWLDTLRDWLASVPREHLHGLRKAARGPLHAMGMGPARHPARRTVLNDCNSGPRWLRWLRRRTRRRPQLVAGGVTRSDRDRFTQFTERARQVLTLSQDEAVRHHHTYIGPEHLLLGIVREGNGVAPKVLSNLGVEPSQMRGAVEFHIGRGDRIVVGEVGLTPRAKKVIELAVDEARGMEHHYVGTEHLLLALVREGESIAADALKQQGLSLAQVREETLRVLAEPRQG